VERAVLVTIASTSTSPAITVTPATEKPAVTVIRKIVPHRGTRADTSPMENVSRTMKPKALLKPKKLFLQKKIITNNS